eukprot:gene6962-7747_t
MKRFDAPQIHVPNFYNMKGCEEENNLLTTKAGSMKMACLPFCLKLKDDSERSVRLSEGKVATTTDDCTNNEVKNISENGGQCVSPVGCAFTSENSEHVICSYDNFDDQLRDCDGEIIKQITSSSASETSIEDKAVIKCTDEEENKDYQAKTTCLVGEQSGGLLARAAKDKQEILGSLGREIAISESLHNYVQQARKQHLRPLEIRSKTGCGEASLTVKNEQNVTGCDTSILGRSFGRVARIIPGLSNRQRQRKVLVDVRLPVVPYTHAEKQTVAAELGREDLKSADELISMELLNENEDEAMMSKEIRKSNKQVNKKDEFKENNKVGDNNEVKKYENRSNEIMTYDEDEIIMMEMIEKEFSSPN